MVVFHGCVPWLCSMVVFRAQVADQPKGAIFKHSDLDAVTLLHRPPGFIPAWPFVPRDIAGCLRVPHARSLHAKSPVVPGLSVSLTVGVLRRTIQVFLNMDVIVKINSKFLAELETEHVRGPPALALRQCSASCKHPARASPLAGLHLAHAVSCEPQEKWPDVHYGPIVRNAAKQFKGCVRLARAANEA